MIAGTDENVKRTATLARRCAGCGEHKLATQFYQTKSRLCRRCADAKMQERFWPKVRKGPDCWEWQAGRFTSGYGSFRAYGSTYAAHRVAWMLTTGPIDAGLFVCHHCDNRPCCRPDHLFLGTTQDNTADKMRKGRAACGSRSGTSRLLPSQVREMRARFTGQRGEMAALGREYGITRAHVRRIVTGQIWRVAE